MKHPKVDVRQAFQIASATVAGLTCSNTVAAFEAGGYLYDRLFLATHPAPKNK